MSQVQKSLIRKAERENGRLLKRFENAVPLGNEAAIKRTANRFIHSRSVKLVALLNVRESNPRFRHISTEKIIGMLDDMYAAKPIPDVVEVLTIHKKGKPEFGVQYGSQSCRAVMKFGMRHCALQNMLATLIILYFESVPCQFGINGGTKAALKYTKSLIETVGPWVCELDIASCYPSINTSLLHKFLPISKEVCENLLTPKVLSLVLDRQQYPLIEGVVWDSEAQAMFLEAHLPTVRQGIPQGSSVSPLILECIIGSTLEDLPASAELVNYADNFLIVGGTKTGVRQMAEALREALLTSPAGPLQVAPAHVIHAKKGFEFLGHRIQVESGVVSMRPSDMNLKKFNRKVKKGFAHMANHNISRRRRKRRAWKLRRYIRQWPRSFPLWESKSQYAESYDTQFVMGLKNHILKQKQPV